MSRADKVAHLLREGGELLSSAGVPDPVRQARDLLSIATGKNLVFLIAHPEHEVSDSQSSDYARLLQRRASREPFQQIAGRQEFFGLEFTVTPDVMIPRPETELLVEEGVRLLSGTGSPKICEVGTGSGCIVVSLLHAIPEASAVGLEVSGAALEISKLNAKKLGVAPRLDLRLSDIFEALRPDERFDLIVSNPPYVPSEDIASLQPEVRDHEPIIALTDGADGLTVVESIIRGAPARLAEGGHLLLEIGFNQSAKVLRMFDPEFWSDPTAFPDLQGIPRMIKASVSDT